jgi:pyruvate dehydrogenase E2 component (dihydrolipoamide acetyltransferase)
MPVEVILPKVDMDMTHGTLSVWHVAEGDLVRQGAALFDIETDKAAMEVESPATGHLRRITANPGDKVAVGAIIGWIYAAGEVVGVESDVVTPASVVESPRPAQVDLPAPVAASPPASVGPRATPAARKAIRVAGLDLLDITGSGPLGRIQRDDVAKFLSGQRAPEASGWAPTPGPLAVTRRAGQGAPVLLLHGFAADSPSWAPFEKAFSKTRPLIRIDLPNHGKSPLRRVQGFADLSRMMVDAFDAATRDEDAVHLVGHSLGGALALALADIRGRKVASLTLIAPAGLGPQIDAATLNGIARASRVESLTPWLRRLTATPDGISDDYARAAMRIRQDPALRAAQCDMIEALFPDGVQAFDLRPALQRLTVPAQILWGRRDHVLPMAQAIAAEGDFALHLLSGAGHIPQIECPDRVARITQQLINAVEVSG